MFTSCLILTVHLLTAKGMQVPNHLSDGSSETQHVLADANCQSSW